MTDKALEAALKAWFANTTKGWAEAMQSAISAYLSALPGEAEVVGLVEKMRRGTPERLVGIGRHGDRIIDVDLAATDALLLKAADALQSLQARVAAAERERDEANAGWGHTSIMLGAALSRAEAAEASVKELREAFRHADASDWEHLFVMLHDTFRGRFWKAVLTDARTALKGGSNG